MSVTFLTNEDEKRFVKSVNGTVPDENGNVEIQASADEPKDGITPHIGDNGNWFIGDTDTGMPSRGEDGNDGQDGSPGKDGEDGQPGKDGTSPTVSVSAITGGHRITITDVNGTKTVDVMDGSDGKDGSNGEDGQDGSPGKDGADGVSVTHQWEGTVLKVTSASGTTSADLKGDKGDTGDTGPAGKDGSDANVTAESITSALGFTPANDSDVGQLSNQKANKATTLSGYGITDGATKAYVDDEIKKLGQLMPEFADSIEGCTDTSKVYVLPDGYIYAYKKVGGYTNLVPTSIDSDGSVFNSKGYMDGQQLTPGDAGTTQTAQTGLTVTGFIPVTCEDIIRMAGVTWGSSPAKTNIMFYTEDFMACGGYTGNGYTVMVPTSVTGESYQKSVLQDKSLQSATTVDGVTTFNLVFFDADTGNQGWAGSRVAYMRISAIGNGADMVVTVNEEIAGDADGYYAWCNTGVAFVSGTENSELEQAITDLKKLSYTFKDKKVMFFGDSITYDESMYVTNLLNSTGMVRVANFAINGATLNNYSDTEMNGSPAQDGTHNNTVPNQVQKLLNNVASYETPDIVIVSAGTNGGTTEADYEESQYASEDGTYIELDTVSLTKFSGAIRWIYEKLISCYPNAKIFFATPIQSYGGGSRTFAILSAKAECIRQNCERLSTPCIDAFRKSGIYGRYEVQSANGKYLKDGLHPNADGAVVLAKCYHRELANALID